jgi:cytochrome c oxidase subunit 2
MNFPIFPPQGSAFAHQVDHLYFALIAFSAAMILLVVLPIIYFLFKYRRGKRANRREPRLPETVIEITWITIPLLLMVGLYAWGADLYFHEQRPPPNALEINVIGKQWMWKTQHPEGNREINELHVPLGRTIRLNLASQDVIHSFFLPAFRIKKDVIPGYYTTEWFQATKLGTFHIFCAEYCGTHHSGMIGNIIVMEPAEYERWLASGRPTTSLVQAGEKRFRELGCSGCHMGNSVVRSPPLEGVFGKPVPLQTGGTVTADEGYIRDSILLPNSQIVAGYQPVMPSFQGHVTEEEVLELVAYIKSLGSRPVPETLGSKIEEQR